MRASAAQCRKCRDVFTSRHFFYVILASENLVAAIVAAPFRVQFICVERACSGSAKQAEADSAASAEQSSDQGSGAGRDADIDQVAVTAVKARAARCDIAARRIGTRRTGVAARAMRSMTAGSALCLSRRCPCG